MFSGSVCFCGFSVLCKYFCLAIVFEQSFLSGWSLELIDLFFNLSLHQFINLVETCQKILALPCFLFSPKNDYTFMQVKLVKLVKVSRILVGAYLFVVVVDYLKSSRQF